MRLDEFLTQAYSKVEKTLAHENLIVQQRELLGSMFSKYKYKASLNPASDPVAAFHYIHSARGVAPDDRAYSAAACCILFLLSADLFDDIQDDDLEGTLHQKVGFPIAINDAIALLTLALHCLGDVMAAERDRDSAMTHIRLFNRISIQAVCGQYLDLDPNEDARSLSRVLEINEAKTSSLALIAESAALCANCDEPAVDLYRRAGRHMSALVQLVDDVRDIFGKETSPDLATGKTSFPIAVFRESAKKEDLEQFEHLRSKIPESLKKIRELLYANKIVERCAEAIEKERTELHDLLSSTGAVNPGHRMWLQVADSLAGAIYELPQLESSRALFAPNGKWHQAVRREAMLIHNRLAEYDLPSPPPLVPWHRREWVFEPIQNRVFYSDIEEQAEEILPVQAQMLGTNDLEETSSLLWRTMPAVLAHELFHFWRHSKGLITEDLWLEEWAANRLAAAYLQRYCPEITNTVVEVTDRIIRSSGMTLGPDARKILESLESNVTDRGTFTPRTYGLTIEEMVLLHAEMVRKIHRKSVDIADEMDRWLPRK